MPVFRLTDELIFPPPALAEPDGLLAVGGDLSVPRLLLAYSQGIFPWFSPGEPVLWWSPDPRLVLFPDELKVSRSLRQTLRKGVYRTTMNIAFGEVLAHCASAGDRARRGTWLTPGMREAYLALHRGGHALSVEAWDAAGGALRGGLYAVRMGRAVFGESMFALARDASKVALAALAEYCRAESVAFIDCQMPSEHLERMGARAVPRAEFLRLLREAL
jgi:leucyl/phenylalanyl-tRNA--protein transferase